MIRRSVALFVLTAALVAGTAATGSDHADAKDACVLAKLVQDGIPRGQVAGPVDVVPAVTDAAASRARTDCALTAIHAIFAAPRVAG